MSDDTPKRRGRPRKAGERYADGTLKRTRRKTVEEIAEGRLRRVTEKVETLAMRQDVMRLTSIGSSQEEIANALQIPVTALLRRFSDELMAGHPVMKRRIVAMMFEGAEKGQTGMISKLFDLIQATGGENEMQADRPAAPEREPRLGKKEQALRDVDTAAAGSDWGDDLNLATGKETVQ